MIRTLFALTSLAAASAQEDLLVSTTTGLIQGHLNEVGVKEWQGKFSIQ